MLKIRRPLGRLILTWELPYLVRPSFLLRRPPVMVRGRKYVCPSTKQTQNKEVNYIISHPKGFSMPNESYNCCVKRRFYFNRLNLPRWKPVALCIFLILIYNRHTSQTSYFIQYRCDALMWEIVAIQITYAGYRNYPKFYILFTNFLHTKQSSKKQILTRLAKYLTG